MSIQNKEIAEVFRKEKLAWDSKDIDGIISAIGRFGFGYRTSAWRDYAANTREQMRSALENFYNDVEYLRRSDTELSTWSEGDIGLAWGFSMEECKHKGQPPERVRTRFTQVYKKRGRSGVCWCPTRISSPLPKKEFIQKNLLNFNKPSP